MAMLSTSDLLAWGASLHYPRIVLDREKRDCLGEHAWQTLLASNDHVRIARLHERKARWMARKES